MKLGLALLILLGTSAAADVVVLNDGTRLSGQLSRSGSALTITLADGSARQLDDREIKSIQKLSVRVAPDAELASLRRQIAIATEPANAADRLRDFIARYPGTPSAASAEKDLRIWQHRADTGLVRLGDNWLTPAQYAASKSQSGPAIASIRLLLADGKSVEAQKALAPALKTWPNNASLLFLNGVALYRAKQLVPARQAFEAAAVQDPSNATIHNNLAVILWQTHQQMGALLEYEKGMIGDTAVQIIIDNVREALHAAPPVVVSSAIGQRVSARFEILDTQLRATMLERHLHRYGSEWIDEAEYSARSKHDLSSEDLKTTYALRAHRIEVRLAEIDRVIGNDLETLGIIDLETDMILPDGSIMHYDHPPVYGQLVQNVADLKLEKVTKTKELQSLPKRLNEARANPGPRWTGAQTLMESESLRVATTQPSNSVPATTQP